MPREWQILISVVSKLLAWTFGVAIARVIRTAQSRVLLTATSFQPILGSVSLGGAWVATSPGSGSAAILCSVFADRPYRSKFS
jgi:hypothetical protein